MNEIVHNITRVGVGVIIRKDGKILMKKRISKHGNHTRAPIGGHLEFQEDPITCAKRETLEEANITLKNCQMVGFTDDHFPDKHYITLLVLADYDQGELVNREPESCETLERVAREDIASYQPLFLSMENVLKS